MTETISLLNNKIIFVDTQIIRDASGRSLITYTAKAEIPVPVKEKGEITVDSEIIRSRSAEYFTYTSEYSVVDAINGLTAVMNAQTALLNFLKVQKEVL